MAAWEVGRHRFGPLFRQPALPTPRLVQADLPPPAQRSGVEVRVERAPVGPHRPGHRAAAVVCDHGEPHVPAGPNNGRGRDTSGASLMLSGILGRRYAHAAGSCAAPVCPTSRPARGPPGRRTAPTRGRRRTWRTAGRPRRRRPGAGASPKCEARRWLPPDDMVSPSPGRDEQFLRVRPVGQQQISGRRILGHPRMITPDSATPRRGPDPVTGVSTVLVRAGGATWAAEVIVFTGDTWALRFVEIVRRARPHNAICSTLDPARSGSRQRRAEVGHRGASAGWPQAARARPRYEARGG